jgi:putative transposase
LVTKNPPMPQSLSNIIVHIIFSTKNREPLITEFIQTRLHAYMATVVRNLNGECYRAGGVSDHVHLATRLPRTIAICKLVEIVKTSSSKWMKKQSTDLNGFGWQHGYAALSINPDGVPGLCQYIERQAEHHHKVSFKDEYRKLLRGYGIEFDERYMWD